MMGQMRTRVLDGYIFLNKARPIQDGVAHIGLVPLGVPMGKVIVLQAEQAKLPVHPYIAVSILYWPDVAYNPPFPSTTKDSETTNVLDNSEHVR